MARVTIAMLQAEIEALRGQIAAAPVATGKASTFRTKAQREAGDGFACTVNPPCSRRDLRTAGAAVSHDTKAPAYHVAR